uniref:FISUMP domain-containing protein n=1 Tax=Algoriphagus sp. TaxID=1872435 RepID=UPI0040478D97
QTLTFYNGAPAWVETTANANTVFNPQTGKIWMDRNLGASQVATSSTDAASYGDLYQWGRGADGHQIRTSGTTTTLSTTDAPGNGNFILAPNSPYDWRSSKEDNLWQGVSGVNNPCPTGYRIPTDAEWDAERLSWGSSSQNAAGALASPLKLPMAGSRSYSNGSLNDTGNWGYYWSSTVSSTNARNLYFLSSDANMNTNFRAYGSSVRCIKD